MKASIMTIGTEILVGSIINTHGRYLSQKLSDLGVHVVRHVSVRDDLESMEQALRDELIYADLVIICGGLGPTEDDATKQSVAKVLGRDIYLHEGEYKKLLARFEKNNRAMTANNKHQAEVIDGAELLINHWGIAPGEVLEYENKKLILLPGPPKELEPMVEAYLEDIIHNDSEIIIHSLNVAGLGESRVEDRMRKLNLETSEISLNTFAKFYDTEIKIIAEGKDRLALQNQVDTIVHKLYDAFEGYIYSEGNQSLAETLVDRLRAQHLTISFAESITGGKLASMITAVPHASEVLQESYVTYSNTAKHKILGVDSKTLQTYGAVSQETAEAMVRGLQAITTSTIHVATTGEAGPEPAEKEVGTVYISYGMGDIITTEEHKFNGSRTEIQQRVCDTILLTLILMLRR
ncbi:CinA family nicotinamide mononucleotide deamidase-related protein [Peptoniphilus equinus]|uniref:Putative competence-damage inducible protein n=1 Tax=Peptoniphilus equinus TaxID=3016343 RepID=A0ABY7QV68_9FIRM|nr:CinA family nicotinamide mononucleotide deamidase-related protein [Peptoniphilus equinus]WBW50689.1 CinA family nicotinamide mononucleotide deamidase-related protein [Peptoniphilus equinus]